MTGVPPDCPASLRPRTTPDATSRTRDKFTVCRIHKGTGLPNQRSRIVPDHDPAAEGGTGARTSAHAIRSRCNIHNEQYTASNIHRPRTNHAGNAYSIQVLSSGSFTVSSGHEKSGGPVGTETCQRQVKTTPSLRASMFHRPHRSSFVECSGFDTQIDHSWKRLLPSIRTARSGSFFCGEVKKKARCRPEAVDTWLLPHRARGIGRYLLRSTILSYHNRLKGEFQGKPVHAIE